MQSLHDISDVSIQKGFGDETDTLQDELEEFFAQWGPVSAVRMRRMDGSKKFKVCIVSYLWIQVVDIVYRARFSASLRSSTPLKSSLKQTLSQNGRTANFLLCPRKRIAI